MIHLLSHSTWQHVKDENCKGKSYTWQKTPGENSETMPSFPAKSTILKMLITAERVCSKELTAIRRFISISTIHH